MAWLAKSSRTVKIACGLVAGVGAVAYAVGSEKVQPLKKDSQTQNESPKREAFNSSRLPVNKVLASYTTNFEPTQKWDFNWDRLV